MNSTFSRKFTFCVFSTFSRRNILVSALPRTTIIHGRKLILLTGPSHSHISTKLTLSKPRDVCAKIGNGCFSIFFGFISAKLLYNTCNEFRTYLSATSQLITRCFPRRNRREYHLPVTNYISYLSAVAVLKIQIFVSNFSNYLQIIYQNTFTPSTHPTEIHHSNNNDINSNNNTQINNNDINVNNNNTIHPNDNYKQHKLSLYSILSPYLPRILIHNSRKKHIIPDVIPIRLPTHKYIPLPAPYPLNSSATQDARMSENTPRHTANNTISSATKDTRVHENTPKHTANNTISSATKDTRVHENTPRHTANNTISSATKDTRVHENTPRHTANNTISSATQDTRVHENTLRNAANNGNHIAGFNLGMMYASGSAVGQDIQLAHQYFKTGSYSGNNPSKLISTLLILKLTLNKPNPRVVNK